MSLLVMFEEDSLALDPTQVVIVRELDESDLDPRTGEPLPGIGLDKQTRIDLRTGTWVYTTATWKQVLDRLDEAMFLRGLAQ